MVLIVSFVLAGTIDSSLLTAFKFRRSEIIWSAIASLLARATGIFFSLRFMNPIFERMKSPFVLSPPSENTVRLQGLALFLFVNILVNFILAQVTMRSYRAEVKLLVSIVGGFVSFVAVVFGIIAALLFFLRC